MPSISIRELRDTRQLLAWLEAGQTVELRRRNSVVASIVPARQRPAPAEWPDFAARRKSIFGDRLVPGADLLIEDREKSRY